MEMQVERSARHKARLKVKFGTVDAVNSGFLEDISATGVKINANKAFAPGTTLKINIIDDMTNTNMIAEGYVAWADKMMHGSFLAPKNQMGIQFIRTSSLLKSLFVRIGNA